MDDPQSAKQIQKFIETYGVNVDEVELELSAYPTFNDFFARKLKPGVRPIAAPGDDSILVSPADCRLLVFPSIEDTTRIWLKGQNFTVGQLLGPKFQHHLKHFHNPAIAIARLAPQDYHRWHLPIAATVGERQTIDGTYFSVSPRAVREVNILCTNKREVCMFSNPLSGPWCLIAVGAAMVSSIVVSDAIQSGGDVAKGAEHGWFKFGGSTLIMIFDSHRVEWDDDLIAASRKPIETYVKVGTRIGRLRTSKTHARQASFSFEESSTTVHAHTPPSSSTSVTRTGLDSSPSLSSAPSPTPSSLIHTATTDAARKEASLNDEGLLHDFPFTMQSNLTLVPLSDGDTIVASGVPPTTDAARDAAEAAGGDITQPNIAQTILAQFMQEEEEEEEDAESVPAPQVFQLMHFKGDEDDDEEEQEDDEDGEEAMRDDNAIEEKAADASSSHAAPASVGMPEVASSSVAPSPPDASAAAIDADDGQPSHTARAVIDPVASDAGADADVAMQPAEHNDSHQDDQDADATQSDHNNTAPRRRKAEHDGEEDQTEQPPTKKTKQQ